MITQSAVGGNMRPYLVIALAMICLPAHSHFDVKERVTWLVYQEGVLIYCAPVPHGTETVQFTLNPEDYNETIFKLEIFDTITDAVIVSLPEYVDKTEEVPLIITIDLNWKTDEPD